MFYETEFDLSVKEESTYSKVKKSVTSYFNRMWNKPLFYTPDPMLALQMF